jgi:penicillin G amidase
MSSEESRAGPNGGNPTPLPAVNGSGMRVLAPIPAAVGMLAFAIAGCAAIDGAATEPSAPAEPRFEAVQPELFSAPGAQPIAVADFDGDGHLDFFVGFRAGTRNRLYRNNGDGTFTDVAEAAGIADEPDTRAAAWGDFDGNGLPDLYVGFTSRSPIANRLYRNDGDGTFTPVNGVVPDVTGDTRQVSWVDFDNDGSLDLFVAFREQPNKLFRNESGRFVDVAPALGLDDPRKSVGAVWFDSNGNGRLDLFVANQDGDLNALYRNEGDRFVEIAAELGLEGAAHRAMASDHGGVGIAVADFDNDGRLDLYLANYGPNQLFLNEGDGRFRDVAPGLGAAGDHHSVTARAGDFDNDGRVDVYVTTFLASAADARDQLYRNRGDSFVDVIPSSIDPRDGSHGAQWMDIDGNGALDLLLANNADEGSHPVYRNLLPADRAGRSLQVLVQDARGRLTRPGSEVRLFRAGTREVLGTGLVDTGGGYSAQNMMPLHFGLGAYDGKVDVEVTYLTGTGRQVVRVADVDPADWVGKAMPVREGQK